VSGNVLSHKTFCTLQIMTTRSILMGRRQNCAGSIAKCDLPLEDTEQANESSWQICFRDIWSLDQSSVRPWHLLWRRVWLRIAIHPAPKGVPTCTIPHHKSDNQVAFPTSNGKMLPRRCKRPELQCILKIFQQVEEDGLHGESHPVLSVINQNQMTHREYIVTRGAQAESIVLFVILNNNRLSRLSNFGRTPAGCCNCAKSLECGLTLSASSSDLFMCMWNSGTSPRPQYYFIHAPYHITSCR
jgi:hypothetical protein